MFRFTRGQKYHMHTILSLTFSQMWIVEYEILERTFYVDQNMFHNMDNWPEAHVQKQSLYNWDIEYLLSLLGDMFPKQSYFWSSNYVNQLLKTSTDTSTNTTTHQLTVTFTGDVQGANLVTKQTNHILTDQIADNPDPE